MTAGAAVRTRRTVSVVDLRRSGADNHGTATVLIDWHRLDRHSAVTWLWPLVLAGALGLFLLPGVAGAGLLRHRWQEFPSGATALVAVTVSCGVGYAVFWAYFLDHRFGRGVAIAVLIASVLTAVVPSPMRRLVLGTARCREVVVPVALMFVVAVFYNAVLFAHSPETPVELRAQRHLTAAGLAPDNVLPFLLAEHLYDGTDPRALLDDWSSSDRPPLQAGVVLTQLPLASGLGRAHLHYQLLATALQCSWIPAVWALCGVARVSRRATAFTLGMAVFSGFFFLDSVFAWPKLLAASLVVLAYVLLLGRDPPSAPAVALAALGVGLGILAHSGVVFTLVPLAVVVVLRWVRSKPRPGVPALAAGAVVLVVLVVPWSAYKRFYDPPGNKLSKLHLAAMTGTDDRTVAKAVVDAYSDAGVGGAVENKLENVRTLVGPRPTWPALSDAGIAELRDTELSYVARSLGLLNLGWIGAAAWLVRRRARDDPAAAECLTMLAVGVAGLAVWALLMFGPGTTLVIQGSYATMLLLWVGLAGVIGTWSTRWAVGLIAVQVAWFTVAWALGLPGQGQPVDVAAAALAVVSGGACLALLWRLALSPDQAATTGAEPAVTVSSDPTSREPTRR